MTATEPGAGGVTPGVAPRLAALARIVAQLGAAATMDDLTEIVTERASDVIGASRAVFALRDGPDRLRLVGTHGMSARLVRQWAIFDLAHRTPMTDAVRLGRTIVVESRQQMLERYPDLEDEAVERSSVTLALLEPASHEAIGAVGFRFDGRVGPPDPEVLSVLGVLGDMCAQTMLRLQAEERSASRAAQLEFLADASQALAGSLDYRETLRQVASLAVPTHADWCSVQLVDDGVLRTLAVAHVDPQKVALAKELETRWPPDLDRPGGVSEVVRSGTSLLVETVTDEMLVASARDDEHLRIARELGLRSAMSVPLMARDRVLGVMTFVAAESGRRYTPEDIVFAEDLARRAGLAIDNADLYSQTRRTAAVLQATLLPQELPDVPGWGFGAVYRQAGRTDIGGDYYDVAALEDQRLVAVVGDVMGRGVDAALGGSRMRSAVRVLATQHPEPDALARAVDRLMAVEAPTPMASAVYVLFDPGSDSLSMTIAGHPPPLLIRSGEGRYVEDGSPLHGIGTVARPVVNLPFGIGDVLLLYTDGLVERRGEGIDTGLERLRGVAEKHFRDMPADADLDEVLDALVEAVTDPDRHDDVALVGFRRVA
ncbi:PP2C family protein-serine/threonine phosphatase [Intrasporangium flavum]|uniref:PP2C family protein-serine/threonine phosphatase n=1 Tax=Intrasporangium flavum TaxID=1428657 RepID=UPI00096C01F9|nr:GAF domain-containing SpoIIE family protein phosphatase [Intrasporangium flavum]